MTWPEFLLAYVLASSACAFWNRALYRGRWPRVVQTCLLLTTVCFLLDYPAETRELWRFPNTTGILLYETPIENHIFNGTCFFNLLTVYLALKTRRADASRATPGTPTPASPPR